MNLQIQGGCFIVIEDVDINWNGPISLLDISFDFLRSWTYLFDIIFGHNVLNL